jgi:aminoglycoside 3-N-acetyltransferase
MNAARYLSLPAITREEIAEQFRALGLAPGDTVLFHSSLSRIGNVIGGAEAVVEALLDAVGPEGTVAVPTIPYRGSMITYLQSQPLFDLRETPSLMGAITEAVRRHPDALRSREPTHAVAAIGPQAEYLTREHGRSRTPCDEHSPYYRLTLINGWVLLLGCDFRSCTLLHSAEEIARVPFLDFETTYEVACRDGEASYTARLASHSAWVPSNFSAIEPLLETRGVLRRGQVGQAECRLARAKDILDTALAGLRDDPYLLRVRPRET